jgi:hypothetical protein
MCVWCLVLRCSAGKQAAEREGANSVCSVCMDEQCQAVLAPCGHRCLCLKCAHILTKRRGAQCPICRKAIVLVVDHVYGAD